jgi:hypothetical protein
LVFFEPRHLGRTMVRVFVAFVTPYLFRHF